MAHLYLIRHGQASFMAENYDQLSALGQTQAQILGGFLAKLYDFDEVYSGTLNRHIQTMQATETAYLKENNKPFEPFFSSTLWNEHQGSGVHYHHLPHFLEKEPELKELIAQKGYHDAVVKKGLLRLFLQGMKMWSKGEISKEGLETFIDFKKRITSLHEQMLIDLQKKQTQVIAFTSGGTIAMLVAIILQLSDEQMIELSWQIRNCSITSINLYQGKFFIQSINEIGHFTDKALISYV